MPAPLIIAGIASAVGGFLFNAARQYLPGIIGRCLAALGIGFLLNEVAIPSLLGMIQSQLAGLGAFTVSYFGALGLDIVCSIIIGATAGRATQKLVLGKIAA